MSTEQISTEGESAEFSELLRSVREGSEDAAWELIARYSSSILRVVRRRLPAPLRPKFDSTDFVQATWASIFSHRSRLVRFEQPAQFVAFIATVAANKIGMEIRRRIKGQKFNVLVERPLEESAATVAPTHRVGQPTPSAVAIAKERWQQMVEQRSPRQQAMIRLRYAGNTFREIAEQLNCDERTVRRVIDRLLREKGS